MLIFIFSCCDRKVFSPTIIPIVTIMTSTEGAKELRVNPAVARAPPVTIATRLLNLLVMIPASGAEINTVHVFLYSGTSSNGHL